MQLFVAPLFGKYYVIHIDERPKKCLSETLNQLLFHSFLNLLTKMRVNSQVFLEYADSAFLTT